MKSLEANSQNTSQEKSIEFPGKDHLTKAVVEGTLRYFIGEFGVFISFILAEPDGNYSVCYGRGEKDKEPMGESFTRWMTFSSLDETRSALVRFESLSVAYLKSDSEETNA